MLTWKIFGSWATFCVDTPPDGYHIVYEITDEALRDGIVEAVEEVLGQLEKGEDDEQKYKET